MDFSYQRKGTEKDTNPSVFLLQKSSSSLVQSSNGNSYTSKGEKKILNDFLQKISSVFTRPHKHNTGNYSLLLLGKSSQTSSSIILLSRMIWGFVLHTPKFGPANKKCLSIKRRCLSCLQFTDIVIWTWCAIHSCVFHLNLNMSKVIKLNA